MRSSKGCTKENMPCSLNQRLRGPETGSLWRETASHRPSASLPTQVPDGIGRSHRVELENRDLLTSPLCSYQLPSHSTSSDRDGPSTCEEMGVFCNLLDLWPISNIKVE